MRQTVEQINLRQFAVWQFIEQWLLPFLDNAFAARHLQKSRLNDHRRRRACIDRCSHTCGCEQRFFVFFVRKCMHLGLYGREQLTLFTLLQRLLTQSKIFLYFALDLTRHQQAIDLGTDCF